jgi:hypothetical protein
MWAGQTEEVDAAVLRLLLPSLVRAQFESNCLPNIEVCQRFTIFVTSGATFLPDIDIAVQSVQSTTDVQVPDIFVIFVEEVDVSVGYVGTYVGHLAFTKIVDKFAEVT